MTFTRGPLARFSEKHPDDDLYIEGPIKFDMCDPYYRIIQQLTLYSTHIVACYSRERDAKRALRALGYVQEGQLWRLVPMAQRESETQDANTV